MYCINAKIINSRIFSEMSNKKSGAAISRARFCCIYFGAPRATAFEPRRKRIEICIRKWYCGRGCKTTIRAEKLCEQLQPSRSGRQIRQNVKEKDNE